jgi:hypothetical protein
MDKLEIKEQVQFKMDQFWVSLENRIRNQWVVVFNSGSQKEEYYRQALLDIKQFFEKERNMCLPYNSMLMAKTREFYDGICKNIGLSIDLRGKTKSERLRIERIISIEIDKIISYFNSLGI